MDLNHGWPSGFLVRLFNHMDSQAPAQPMEPHSIGGPFQKPQGGSYVELALQTTVQ